MYGLRRHAAARRQHDDQVDASGLAGQLLDKMVASAKPKVDVDKPHDRWHAAFSRRSGGVADCKVS
jgi:hypothetical protein